MYHRNSRQLPSKNLTFLGMNIDNLFWVAPLLLAGGLFLLDLWRLAVYPATIGLLALWWAVIAREAEERVGIVNHKLAMGFSIFPGAPAMLFLAWWTFVLSFNADPLTAWVARTLGILVVLAFVFSNRLGDLSGSVFAKLKRRGSSRQNYRP